MEIEVSTDRIHVIVNIFNFLCFSQDIHIFHFFVCHSVEGVDQVFSQLKRKLILREVSESLINKPDMHICNRMVYVEIVGDVHRVYELPRVYIHQHSLQRSSSLHQTSLMPTFKSLGISEISQHPPELCGFLNVLMDVHAV